MAAPVVMCAWSSRSAQDSSDDDVPIHYLAKKHAAKSTSSSKKPLAATGTAAADSDDDLPLAEIKKKVYTLYGHDMKTVGSAPVSRCAFPLFGTLLAVP